MGKQEEGCQLGKCRLQRSGYAAVSVDSPKSTLTVCQYISERFFILIMWNSTDTPLAYFISFRTYGTWLHGDERGSIDRFNNCYGKPYLPKNHTWQTHNRRQLKRTPVILGAIERGSVETAIRETCRIRKWHLHAFNVRTNHVHIVVTANSKPAVVLNAFKANATSQLREHRLWRHPFSPWSDRGSKIRLWNERSVANAIDYVLHGQGEDLPKFED
jgi:REP element-mobilizing transposase RayT